MQSTEPKRSGGAKALIAIGLVLALLLSATGGFWLFGGFDALFGSAPLAIGRTKAAPAYVATGEVRAMRLAPPTAGTEEELRAYFSQAAAFAEAAGLNTIIFQAKQGMTVWWRDGIFPAPAVVTAQDSAFHKTDPLALLCEALAERPIQLWLEIDPYASGSYGADARGKAVDYSDTRGDAAHPDFLATDAGYAELLSQSLGALPVYYSVAGIVFTGFSAGAEATDAQKVDFALPFEKLLTGLQTAYAAEGRDVSFALSFGAESGLMDTGFAQNLMQGGLVSHLLPAVEDGPGLSARLDAYGTAGLVVTPPVGTGAALYLFTAGQHSSYAGAVLAAYPQDSAPEAVQALASTLTPADSTLPTTFDIPKTLTLSYPAQGASQSAAGLFIMGTSNPAQPLLMDGEEVTTRSADGFFGIYVELAMGPNSFILTQGEERAVVTITRIAPSGGSSGGGTRTQPPGSVGQAIRISGTIGTAYTANGGISETFPKGAVFIVQSTVATADGGSYQLKSGDYVPASFCETLGAGGTASFTGISVTPDDGGEWLIFEGGGSPAAYVAYGDEDGTLRLTFYDTALQLPAGLAGSLFSSATVENFDDGRTVLTLQTNGLWGYSLEYPDGGTRLYLKAPPRLSGDARQPLAGVHILLDPGHGLDDKGSPGLMWSTGPHEKDVNLALAQAIAYRLRQLGATVTLTRNDDSFPTLYERLQAQTDLKPDFFLSVHHNALDPVIDINNTSGVEAYYYHPYNTPSSQGFAQNLLDHVSLATGRTARKVDWNYFYVTRTTVCPSVLFEYGFMMNPDEFEDITSQEGIWNAAFATADAIVASMPG